MRDEHDQSNHGSPSGRAGPSAASPSEGTEWGQHPANVLLINNVQGYPQPIEASRFHRDAKNGLAADRLAQAVLGRGTDRNLHYNAHGTFVVVAAPEYPTFPSFEWDGVHALVDLVEPINDWFRERARTIRKKRHSESKLEELNSKLDEFGYRELRATLISLAGKKPWSILLRSVDGRGGTLEIPPKSHIVIPEKAVMPVDGHSAEVTRIRAITHITDHAGALFEVPSNCVSAGVAEGKHARVLRPRQKVEDAHFARDVEVVLEDKGSCNEKD